MEKTEVILDMATQTCAAMLYLEENGFIHRDLVGFSLYRARLVMSIFDLFRKLFMSIIDRGA